MSGYMHKQAGAGAMAKQLLKNKAVIGGAAGLAGGNKLNKFIDDSSQKRTDKLDSVAEEAKSKPDTEAAAGKVQGVKPVKG